MPPAFPRRPLRVAVLSIVTLLIGVAPAAAETIPLPEDDPFFAVPKKQRLARLENGEILKSREVEVNSVAGDLRVTAWQVKYKTIDVHGDPSAYVTTVMVPFAPWKGEGPRPLVSYQTAEDGVDSKCAPSYGLRGGPESTSSNSRNETVAMAAALARGWAVAAPDYEGPRSEFMGAKGEARGVIDGLRAALAFEPAGFEPRTRVGLWGYSGGALASSLAAQLQPRYAPELKLAGIALGGVPAEWIATIRAFSGSPFGGALAMGFAALDRSYPRVNLPQYLNEAGLEAMAASQDFCINDAVREYPLARMEQYTKDPNLINAPPAELVSLLQRISPLWFRGTPSAPVYTYHAVLDELAPIGPARKLVERYCAAGVPVFHREDGASDHITLTATGAVGAMSYLDDRFDGAPAPTNC